MGKPSGLHNVQINEIFRSLQGEGRRQGELTTFVRVTGCNLRCSWCDTAYAYDKGADMTVDEVIGQVRRLDCLNVCVTGGEPLLQENIERLFSSLKSIGCFVAVETNGTQEIRGYRQVDQFTVDYKLSSAGAGEGFRAGNFAALTEADELKFIIGDRGDYNEAKLVIGEHKPRAKVLFSPCWGEDVAVKLADWIIEDKLPVRYSLQLHKVLWGEKETGIR